MLKRIPLNQFALFEAAARHVSFTRAAAEFGVTQSAVSQQIRLLEHRLGRALFRRLPRSLALTDDGRALLSVVSASLRGLVRGTAELFPPPGRQRVVLKATIAFAQFCLMPRLGDLLAAAPALDLRLVTAVWAGEGPEPGVDLEVRAGLGDWPGLTAERLTSERLFPVAAPGVARRLTQPGALIGERLIHALGWREAWPTWFAAAGLVWPDPPPPGLECDTAALSLAAAAAGLGVALGRSSLVAGALRDGRLVAPFRLRPVASEVFWLVYPAGRPLTPAAEQVRRFLLSREARRPSASPPPAGSSRRGRDRRGARPRPAD